MKRSFFGRYGRYISFLLCSIVFLYAGVGLVFYYVGEYKTEQTFESLAKRVAAAELAEETSDAMNAPTGSDATAGDTRRTASADNAAVAPVGGSAADASQPAGFSSLADTQQQNEPADSGTGMASGDTGTGQPSVAAGQAGAAQPIAAAAQPGTGQQGAASGQTGAGQSGASGQRDAGQSGVSGQGAPTGKPTATPKPAATQAPAKSGVIDILRSLYAENADLGGWITISGTVLDYPVMYTPRDPEKYIRLSFKGDISSSGVPFIGKGCKISPQSDNMIIYGHNMRKGTMFASLLNYRSASYYQQHPTIRFSTLYNTADYDIIAAFQTDVYDADTLRCYKFINAQSADDFNSFINAVKSASMYNTGVSASYGDKLITLSTCSYHTTDGRFVVIARKR